MPRLSSLVTRAAVALALLGGALSAQDLVGEMTRVLGSLEGVTYRVVSEVSEGGEEFWPAVDALVAVQRTPKGIAMHVEGSWQDGTTTRRFRCDDDGFTMTWVDADINAHHTTQNLATRQKAWSRAPLVQAIEPLFASPPTVEQLVGKGTSRTTTTVGLDGVETRGLVITPRGDPAVAKYELAVGAHDRLPRLIERTLVGVQKPDGSTWRGTVTRRFTSVVPRRARLPEAALRNAQGQTVSTTELTGQPTLVVFWATWCHACHEVLPLVADLGTRHGARLVAIHAHDEARRSDARKALTALSRDYELRTDGTALATQLGVTSLPTILLLDGDGRLVSTSVGLDTASHSRLSRALQLVNQIPSLPSR